MAATTRSSRLASRKDAHRHSRNNPGERSLSSIAFLAELPSRTVRRLEKACTWTEAARATRIIQHGDPGDSVFFLVTGSVHVLTYSPSGRVISFDVVTAGGFFGELAVIDGQPRSATVVARTPCLVAELPSKAFMRLVDDYAAPRQLLLKKMAGIIRAADKRIVDLSILGAEQRVYLELLRLAEPDPCTRDRLWIHPTPTQEAIAGSVGATRETVARAFGRLADAGIIRRKGKATYIDNKERLEGAALSIGSR